MFPFGVSLNELLLIAAALGIAGGYRETMIKHSRSGGLYVGRIIGVIRQKREQLLTGTSRAEVRDLRTQLSEAVQQMQSIKYEVSGAARWSRGPDGVTPNKLGAPTGYQGSSTAALSEPSPSPRDPSLPFAAQTLSSRPDADGQNNLMSTPDSLPLARKGDDLQEALKWRAAGQMTAGASLGDEVQHIAGLPVIPVSAAMAGRSQKKTGESFGSHIVEEALAEQEVAQKAAAFLRIRT